MRNAVHFHIQNGVKYIREIKIALYVFYAFRIMIVDFYTNQKNGLE